MPTRAPQPGGLPDGAENAQLGDVEDLIVREVEAVTIGVLALVLTTGVMKELVARGPVHGRHGANVELVRGLHTRLTRVRPGPR